MADSPSDDVVNLDISFHELNLEDDATKPDEQPNSSRRSLFQKHDLTPNSKQRGLPQSKVRRTTQGDTLQQLLDNVCKEEEGSTVSQGELLEVLGIDDDLAAKSRVSRAVAAVFPNSKRKRMLTTDNKQIQIYTNLKFKHEIQLEMAFGDTVPDRNKHEIKELEATMSRLWEEIQQALDEKNQRLVETLLLQYRKMNIARENHLTALINIYEKEISRLKNSTEAVSNSQKIALGNEMEKIKKKVNLGYRTGSMKENVDVPTNIFAELAASISEECPIINEILETLIGSKQKSTNKAKNRDYKMRCVGHALAGILSLSNQKYPNDIQLFFGLLSLSYGGGKQFINMLSSIGLSLHWDSLMKHLDERLVNFQQIIDKKFHKSSPVILLMDNINIYRGRKRHYRLFKTLSPKMWNFTGRGAILPNLDGLDHLFKYSITASEPQIDFEYLKADNILLDDMQTHKQVWESVRDAYFLMLFDRALNLPAPPKPLQEMEEDTLHSWLSSLDFESLYNQTKQTHIAQPPMSSVLCLRENITQTETLVLPMSLENNSTLPGTASILEEFAKEFNLPCEYQTEMLDFNEKTHTFDLKGSRTHYEFLKIMHIHRDEMATLEEHILDTSKYLEDSVQGNSDEEISDAEESSTTAGSSAAYVKSKYFEKQDGLFKKTCRKLVDLIWNAVHSPNSQTALDNLISDLSTNRWWEEHTDHFNRSILHYAVEANNPTMVRVILAAGTNPNIKEGCGVTPLHLAVIAKCTEMCKILIDGFALVKGLSFSSLPSPYEMAQAMQLTDILSLFEEKINHDQNTSGQLEALLGEDISESTKTSEDDVCIDDGNEDGDFVFERSQPCGFPTALVGDQGTCKNNRSVKHKDQSAFDWVAEIPGDLHAKGHLCEAVYKAQGKGGFYHLVTKVLNRKKLTSEAFRKKKFQEQNLEHIKEAVRDASVSYGMAAVYEFKNSEQFPSKESLKKCHQKNGNHNQELLDSFKAFMKARSDDANFCYHTEMFCLFGPLLQLFNDATRFGDGLARETVWVILLPIFAQLQFRNYWTEALVHVVNFVAAWPLAFREMIRRNSTVNLTGKDGGDIDLDEFVESFIVRPLKQYSSGHSSVKTCQRIMANVQFMGKVRRLYADKQSFDVHPQTKHTQQSSIPDQMKGMWFCVRQGFFQHVKGREDVLSFEDSKTVPKALISVYEKGVNKVKSKFFRKLHECFPAVRKLSFNRIADDLEADGDFDGEDDEEGGEMMEFLFGN